MTNEQIAAACERILASSARVTVPIVAPLVACYRTNDGHALHVVLDDGNVEDRWVESCRERARVDGDIAGESLARVLMRMTRTQRRRL